MRDIAGVQVAIWVIAFGVATAAFACEGGIVEVVQPLVDQYGVRPSTVSLSRNCVPSSAVPGYEVSLVAEPSCVRHNWPAGTANMNAASFVGIKTEVDSLHGLTSGLLGDTLHVILDLSSLSPMTEDLRGKLHDWSIDDVVRATVKSMLMTAYRSRRGVSESDTVGAYHSVYAKNVWLEVRGSDEYASLGGVFGLAYLDSLTWSEWKHVSW